MWQILFSNPIAWPVSSELGGPSGKLFRFVSCVRARGAYVRSDLGENPWLALFPFPFSPWEVFPFPSALQGPIQLQLALSVRLFQFANAYVHSFIWPHSHEPAVT